MPKINVYLPDDLAESVKDAGIPVSTICQAALEQAVRRVNAIRAAAAGNANIEDSLAQATKLTARARDVVKLARDQARTRDTPLSTGDLLGAILVEGSSLAIHVLRAAEVDMDQLRDELTRQSFPEPPREGGPEGATPFSLPATKALELTAAEAISLGHNYIGCEHLLLGLAAEPDGVAGKVLRGQGAEHRVLRRTVVAAMAGYVHHQAQSTQGGSSTPQAAESQVLDAIRQELAPVIERLARLEERAGTSE
jgi:ATP-dependent Clp protease ATP-binding subunit ClpC